MSWDSMTEGMQLRLLWLGGFLVLVAVVAGAGAGVAWLHEARGRCQARLREVVLGAIQTARVPAPSRTLVRCSSFGRGARVTIDTSKLAPEDIGRVLARLSENLPARTELVLRG
jgi:hypothetical protein